MNLFLLMGKGGYKIEFRSPEEEELYKSLEIRAEEENKTTKEYILEILKAELSGGQKAKSENNLKYIEADEFENLKKRVTELEKQIPQEVTPVVKTEKSLSLKSNPTKLNKPRRVGRPPKSKLPGEFKPAPLQNKKKEQEDGQQEQEHADFYKLLDWVLKSKKISAKELAMRAKIPYNSFRPYRSGKRFSPKQIAKITKIITSL